MSAASRILTLVSLLLLSPGGLSLAQLGPDGKSIAEIRIEIEGPRTIGEAFVRENLQVEAGAAYNPGSIDKSIRNLMATGLIDDVRVLLDVDHPDPDTVVLLFRVTTKPRIAEIRFDGNDKISRRKLEKVILSEPGKQLDEADIDADRRAIRDLYLDKGYWNSRVDVELLRDEGSRAATVVFKIVEMEKRKIRSIVFEGNEHLSSRFLRKQMETAPWRFWRFWSKRSTYRPAVLEEDVEALLAAYRDEGFLDVSIEQDDVRINRKGDDALDLLVAIEEGRRSYVGNVTVTGNAILSADRILEEVRLRQGEPYSPTTLAEDRRRIRDRYGRDGYLDARVTAVRKPNLETGRIMLIKSVDHERYMTHVIDFMLKS